MLTPQLVEILDQEGALPQLDAPTSNSFAWSGGFIPAEDESLRPFLLSFAVRFKKLRPSARIPARANPHAVGMDLFADEHKSIRPLCRELIHTNIAIALPPGYEGQVRCRSGLALKHGIMVVNGVGTIDPDYRGEIGVILFNSGENAFHIAPGDRIAQLVIAQFETPPVLEVKELDETARGAGGYGSTGR